MVKMQPEIKSSHSLVVFIGALLLGWTMGVRPGAAAERDCDGYLVTDTAEITHNLRNAMDSVQSTYLQIDILFWHPSVWVITLDSTLSLWRNWEQELFTNYELYDVIDTLRIKPEYQIDHVLHSGGTSAVLATRQTILKLSKECYVQVIGLVMGGLVSLPGLPTTGTLPLPATSLFNAKGQAVDRRTIPLRPGFLPIYTR